MKSRAKSTALALILLAGALVAAVFLLRKGEPVQLAERTRSTGLALTAEQQSVDFLHADLTFAIHPDRKAIDGKSLLDFRVRQPISRIHFDLDPNLRISGVAVNGRALDRASWSNPQGLATVTLPRSFGTGENLRLAITYAGRPHVAENAPWKGGFVWSTTQDGKPWIATAVQGEGCDVFWPCFDNSLVEIGSVDLHIDVPAGLVAPGNGRFMGVSDSGKSRRTWHWRAARPNNYAISLNVAPYKLLKAPYRSRFGNVLPLYFWYLPGHEKGAAKLFEEFAPTLAFFERRIGPYPFAAEKVAAVETPHLGMEHQTINAYGNAFKPAPEGYDWLFHHEFAHEWFGNQLTNRNWDDMWLHEGFGTYMQPLSIEDRLGRMAYDALLWKQRATLMNRFPLVSGRPRLEHEVYDKATGPGLDIYNKGSWTLHTLRALIGDEAFFRSIRRLVYGRPDPRPGNFQPRFGSTKEFVAIVNQESKRDLSWFFDVYVRSARLPRLKAERTDTALNLQWMTPKGRPFPMPVEIAIDGQIQTLPMSGGRGSIPLAQGSHWTIDPGSKLLRQDDAIDRFRDWTDAQAATTKKS